MKNKTVTIDKKLYEQLILNEKEYQLIFDNMLNGFALHEMIYDKNDNAVDYLFLTANPAYLRITDTENPTGKTVKEIYPNLDNSWIKLYQSILETGLPRRIQKYHEETDRWYDIIGFKVKSKEFAVFFTDVTLFKESEQKIEKSLHLNNSLLDAIPHPAMLIDRNRIILAANEKSKLMGAVVGTNCYDGFSSCSKLCNKGNYCCFCKKGLDLGDMDAKHLEMEDDAYI